MIGRRWYVYRLKDGALEYLSEVLYEVDWVLYAPTLYLTKDRAASMCALYGGNVGICILTLEEWV